ncbi:thioredoxin domain-containing protein 16 isoform X2 [Ictalurus punctatus]|uniref:Thioredoxin domain-containing protein 16 isoform X2 n=1 Tax=Ictalurus punctatus TaxID=7998 RepID=A0A9F7RB91_ICTPU|nr:thioredoxin domain-containing protein 16 isoform X2 [Ictalurus punctatus]
MSMQSILQSVRRIDDDVFPRLCAYIVDQEGFGIRPVFQELTKRKILDESGNEARLNEVFDSNAGMHRTRTMSTWAVVVVLLCFVSERCTSGGNPVKLLQLTAQGFKEHVQTGKTSLIYFGKGADPAVQTFLEQLETSAVALEDYGMSVATVNCSEENVADYCTEDEVMRKAYLFRGADVLRSFEIDTIFDVNAIVSHMLFTVLFNEVRYVHTPAELVGVEKVARGKTDIVMGHVPALGLPEHRALMEAAFVYGGKYQFVQTTGAPLLKHMGIADASSVQARLWFLHCKSVSRPSEPCPHTLMRKPLSTINIHSFLQLMEAPVLTEADVDPDDVDVIYNHLNVPVLFLFAQAETLHMDRSTAEILAWRLRGELGLVLIRRDSPKIKTPLRYNAAYRLPHEEVKYFTLKNVEEVVNLVRGQLFEEGKEEEAEDDEDEDHWASLDVLDDEVAESVYRDRGVTLDMESVSELTADTFTSAVAQNGLTVVLFYVKWDAVSMAFLQSYVEVADALEGVNDVTLASIDCGEWTCVCRDQNVSSFPSVLLFRLGDDTRSYRGMMGTESLYRFILLSHLPPPLFLSSSDEVLSFLEGDLYHRHCSLSPIRALGLFTPGDPDVAVFEEAAKNLRGEIILGLFEHKEAEKWAQEHSVMLPALLVSRGPGVQRRASSILFSTLQEMISHVRRAALAIFPELTVENLPWYLELRKPLLILFVGGEESAETLQSLEEMRKAERTGRLESSLPCWIHLGRTPAGRAVLETYLSYVPPLPALVLSQLSSGGKVYHFPTERPLLSENIVQWLQRIENNQEQAAETNFSGMRVLCSLGRLRISVISGSSPLKQTSPESDIVVVLPELFKATKTIQLIQP